MISPPPMPDVCRPSSRFRRKTLLLLRQELLRYRRKAQSVTRHIGPKASGNLADSAVTTGAGVMIVGSNPLLFKLLGARLPHGEALGIRLEFIGFVVSKSDLELTFALVETLWHDFLRNPICGVYDTNDSD